MSGWAIAWGIATLFGAGWAVVLLRWYATRNTRRARHRKGRP